MTGYEQFNDLAKSLGIPAAIIAVLAAAWFEMGRRRVWVWGSSYEKLEKECERLRNEIARYDEKIEQTEQKYELRIERMRGQVDSAYTYLDRVSQQNVRVTSVMEKAVPALAPPSQPGQG